MDPSPSTQSQWRTVCLLLLVAVVSTQSVAQVHELTARHVKCPTHGELMDATRLWVAKSAVSDKLEMSALPEGPEGHHHQHCWLARAGVKTTSGRIVMAAMSAPSATFVATSFRDAGERVQVPILLAAPKNPPPSHS